MAGLTDSYAGIPMGLTAENLAEQYKLTQDDVEYLRREFSKPLNLRDFVWSVPLGAEQEIYAISMMSMNLDTNAEVSYLKDLAHGLRLQPTLCAQIHQRFGVPVLS